MQIIKILLVNLILLSSAIGCLGQEYYYAEDKNWIKDFGGIYSQSHITINYRLDNYTKEDIPKAKRKLVEIKKIAPKNEWEGIYYEDWGIGDRMMIWNEKSGFVSFYHYHEFRRLNYGRVDNSTDSIRLISEKPFKSNSAKKKNLEIKEELVKVKVGKTHYLVPVKRLKDFLKENAGLYIGGRHTLDYWAKENDTHHKGFKVPILPSKYKHLLRYPIGGKIIKVGRKKVIPSSITTKEYNHDNLRYPITVNVGKNEKVEVGLRFYVKDLKDWITITKVFQKKSIGYIERHFDNNGKEECFEYVDNSGMPAPCKEIKTGMKAKTVED